MKTKKKGSRIETQIEQALVLHEQEGKALLRSALEELQKENQARVVKTVTILLDRMQTMRRIERQTARRIDLTQKQLKAIHEGKFLILESQPPFNIRFHDDELNVSWDETAQW